MGRVKNNLIELFIDKAVLAVAIIVALATLFFFVIGSPNAIEYANKKRAPREIDKSINDRAAELQKKLNEKIQDNDNNSYPPQAPLYLDFIKDSLKNVDTNIDFPLPDYSTGPVVAESRTYQLPKIENIEKPSAVPVPMAAFVPIEELTETVTYDKAETKLADIDLVTVESSINAKQLYESFRSAFAGKDIPNEWKEEQYAKPVFAKVELQRKDLLEDGSWSQWAEVPKTKICHLKKTLQLPMQVSEYEIQIAMVQFAKMEIRNEILQPPAYDNAIAENWLCPSLYTERQKRTEKEETELKKQQLEAEKTKKLIEKTARTYQPAARQTQTQPSSGTGGSSAVQPPPKQPPQKTKSTAPTESQQTLTEEQRFKEIALTEKTNPADLEKLVFWAHDDTTKPGEKYQYRIRIGIFNPIAGKPWFSQEQKDLQNQMVLFSNFSEPTGTIEIPNRLYFFATDIKEIEKGYAVDKTVEVKVARYTLGNWITKTFSVKTGEQIGTIIDSAGTKLEQAGIPSESIDLATGNVMVDARRVTEWVGAGFLRAKEFYELLYCKAGEPIQTVPIKERYWPEEIAKIYKEVTQAEAAKPTALLPRDQILAGTSTSRPISTGYTPSDKHDEGGGTRGTATERRE
jgi:hypothetical protein